MALDDNGGILTMIGDLVDTASDGQKLTERKSNTVVTIIGGVITMLLSGAAYLVESETALPSWFPLVATLLGVLGTVLKINKTPNGVTTSVKSKLQDVLLERFDVAHFNELNSVHSAQPQAQPQPANYPEGFQPHPFEVADNLRAAAEDILRKATTRS